MKNVKGEDPSKPVFMNLFNLNDRVTDDSIYRFYASIPALEVIWSKAHSFSADVKFANLESFEKAIDLGDPQLDGHIACIRNSFYNWEGKFIKPQPSGGPFSGGPWQGGHLPSSQQSYNKFQGSSSRENPTSQGYYSHQSHQSSYKPHYRYRQDDHLYQTSSTTHQTPQQAPTSHYRPPTNPSSKPPYPAYPPSSSSPPLYGEYDYYSQEDSSSIHHNRDKDKDKDQSKPSYDSNNHYNRSNNQYNYNDQYNYNNEHNEYNYSNHNNHNNHKNPSKTPQYPQFSQYAEYDDFKPPNYSNYDESKENTDKYCYHGGEEPYNYSYRQPQSAYKEEKESTKKEGERDYLREYEYVQRRDNRGGEREGRREGGKRREGREGRIGYGYSKRGDRGGQGGEKISQGVSPISSSYGRSEKNYKGFEAHATHIMEQNKAESTVNRTYNYRASEFEGTGGSFNKVSHKKADFSEKYPEKQTSKSYASKDQSFYTSNPSKSSYTESKDSRKFQPESGIQAIPQNQVKNTEERESEPGLKHYSTKESGKDYPKEYHQKESRERPYQDSKQYFGGNKGHRHGGYYGSGYDRPNNYRGSKGYDKRGYQGSYNNHSSYGSKRDGYQYQNHQEQNQLHSHQAARVGAGEENQKL